MKSWMVKLIPGWMGRLFEKSLKKIPFVQRRIDQEINRVMAEMESALKPYKSITASHTVLPSTGVSEEQILSEIEAMNLKEQDRWKDGYVSGAVYHGDQDHIEFLNKVYAMTSQSNPLHSDLWPSAAKYESEIIQMTARMLSAGVVKDTGVCGTVTSGGTESILLAMKTYRDAARIKKGVKRPELVVPVTAHAAFDKACQYFNIRIRHVPVDGGFCADVKAVRKAVNKNTIAIVGSAPSFPHGVIDPIEAMSEIALEKDIGFHTDACLGGFVLPWARELGYDVPPFDFSLKGVTSMSADTHKYGYAAKGTSVVLYRSQELRHFQYYTITDWPGGLYFSPTFAGSRPGALSAACWAAMLKMGKKGYLSATRRILAAADTIKAGIRQIPELKIMGNPLWVVAFSAPGLDIYRVLDVMSSKGWSLNGLHRPACVHIAVTLRHAQAGVAERFVSDLEKAVQAVKAEPPSKTGMAPVYGMAATLPARGIVSDILKKYLDMYYRTFPE